MWIVFSLLSAFGWATSDTFVKLNFRKGRPGERSSPLEEELFVIWFRYFISLIFLLPLVFVLKPPSLDKTFWILHIVWIPLEALALVLYIKAIRLSPLSLTLPLLALTPVFLTWTGSLILDEKVSSIAFGGIITTVVGSYILSMDKRQKHPLRVIISLFRNKGSLLMLIVAFIYSLTAVLGKILILHSSAVYFSLHYTAVMSFVFLPVFLVSKKATSIKLTGELLVSGLFFAVMIIFHMLAVAIATVAYMIALKRLSGVFGVLYGGLLFKEGELKYRLMGSIIMVLGGFIISIA